MSLSASHTKRVPEAEVLAIPEPPFTKTWHPIAHSKVIFALQAACRKIGIEVKGREYSLNQSGTRMFGVWHLANGPQDEVGMSLGMRNAIDKSMVVGLAAGLKVFVCDNLSFEGEYLTFHKHTSGLTDRRLYHLAENAVANAIPKMKNFKDWQEGLKEHPLELEEFKLLTYDAIKAKVIAPGQFNNFHECIERELAIRDYEMTMWTFYGAVTRVHKGASLFHVADKTKRMNDLAKNFIAMRDKPEISN